MERSRGGSFREWSLENETTGDAASTVQMTGNPTLGGDTGLGLSSAIWLEVSDLKPDLHRSGPASPTFGEAGERKGGEVMDHREESWVDIHTANPSNSSSTTADEASAILSANKCHF